MNLVDSCGWLAYFTNSKNADFFEEPILDTESLLVPSICIFEVFKKIYSDKDENSALSITAQMRQGKKVEFDADIAFHSAKLSVEKKLPMADSIILATAIKYEATIWTQDQHFSSILNVKYITK